MDYPTNPSIRTLAVAGIVGGVATALSGVLVQAIVAPASDVSDEMWSYPWTSEALAPVSIVYAGFHFLVFLGMLGLARCRPAGPSRSAGIGALLALAGTFIFFVAEIATIPFAEQRLDDTGPMIVGAAFGLGITLTAVGLILIGLATMRAQEWHGWHRVVPLAGGVWAAVLLGVSFTSALAAGVAIYGLSLVALNIAVYAEAADVRSTRRPARVRAHVEG